MKNPVKNVLMSNSMIPIMLFYPNGFRQTITNDCFDTPITLTKFFPKSVPWGYTQGLILLCGGYALIVLIIGVLYILKKIVNKLILIIIKIISTIKKIIYEILRICLASYPYFVPFSQLINIYRNKLKELPFLPIFIKKFLTKKLRKRIDIDISLFKLVLMFVGDYSHMVILMVAYIFIVKEKLFKVSYFIRFTTMHAILMLMLQTPVLYTYENLFLFPVLNNQVKLFLFNFADAILFLNFYLLFYLIICAASHTYPNIPIISSACEAHIGKKTPDK